MITVGIVGNRSHIKQWFLENKDIFEKINISTMTGYRNNERYIACPVDAYDSIRGLEFNSLIILE